MSVEIERKFLVRGDYKSKAVSHSRIVQGYICSDRGRTVRVRLRGEKGYSTIERNACRPSFDVCGIWGGHTGEGSKTVLPSKAYAKISTRLVPHQRHEVISKLMADYLQSIAPKCVKVKVTPMHGGEGYVCPIDLPAYRAAELGLSLIHI